MTVQPDFEEGKIWMDVLYDTGKSMRDKLNETEDSLRDFKEYLELWIHEIKIPIAALNLMNYNGSQDLKKQKHGLTALWSRFYFMRVQMRQKRIICLPRVIWM